MDTNNADPPKAEPSVEDPDVIRSLEEFQAQWERSVHLELFNEVIESAIASYETFSSVVDTTKAMAEEAIAKAIPAQALLAGYALQTAVARRREFLGRAIYVVAWTAFEDLFTSCLRFVLTKRPALLLARLERDQSKPGHGPVFHALKRMLKEGWEREAVIKELIEAELATLPLGEDMERLPAYLAKLGVTVVPDMITILRFVKKQRNQAAHDASYAPPSVEDARSDLSRFGKAGHYVAATIAKRHNLEVM